MRTLSVLILTFLYIGGFSQNCNMNFVVKDAYYITIDIDSEHNFSIMFDAILNKGDSLLIDTSNKHNFINGILSNSTYVPRCWSSDVFTSLYGDTGIATKSRFSNLFFDEIEKNGRKESLTLKSGEMVYISYIELKGIFVQLNKEISFSHGLDQRDNPKVCKPCIPFAVTEYVITNYLPQKEIVNHVDSFERYHIIEGVDSYSGK